MTPTTTALCPPTQTDLALLAVEINQHHHAAEEAAGSALDHAHEAGVLLRRAKDQCEHGDWGKWLKANFAGSKRTAQVYMQIADPYNWEKIQKRNGVARLQVDQYRALGVKAACKLVAKPVEEAKARVPAGETPAAIAAMFGTAVDDMDKAKVILDSGDEDIVAAVDHGEMDLDEALQQLNSKSPCPKGGEHEWDDDETGRFCRKCKEPGDTISPCPVKRTRTTLGELGESPDDKLLRTTEEAFREQFRGRLAVAAARLEALAENLRAEL